MIANEKMTVDPIPFDEQLLDLALSLKESGLPWSPQTGCFVWDPHGHIPAPSPFSHRVYFILSMSRFLHIFGDVEHMQDKLVWLPTWYQAMHICIQMGVRRSTTTPNELAEAFLSPKDEMVRLYKVIGKALRKPAAKNTGNASRPNANNLNRWILRVMEAELGSLEHLPDAVKRRVESVYRDVSTAYVGWRRIEEHKKSDWVPPENMFEPTLLNDLGHFFSDYQHQIKTLEMIRRTVNLLRSIDRSKDPEAHRQLVKRLAKHTERNVLTHRIMEQLTAPSKTHPRHESKAPGH